MKPRKIVSHKGVATSDKLELFGYPLESVSNLTHRRSKFQVTRMAQIVVSGGLLVASLVVILVPGFDNSAKQWAYGLTATILGFWLKK